MDVTDDIMKISVLLTQYDSPDQCVQFCKRKQILLDLVKLLGGASYIQVIDSFLLQRRKFVGKLK